MEQRVAMSVLGGELLRQRLEIADLSKRLVVSPLLEPDEQLRTDQASIDIRLGFQFALVSASTQGVVDEFDDQSATVQIPTQLYRKQYVPFGSALVIHPHQFILAATLEYVRLPSDLMAYVIGRSTWGRLGLIVATAVGIQPGFAGTLTLELRNLGETPLTLHPGQTIGQLFFHEVCLGTSATGGPAAAAVGQYGGTIDLVPGKISSDQTRLKIAALRARARQH